MKNYSAEKLSVIKNIVSESEILRLILDNVQEKNPIDFYGVTPLHEAAKNGHFETFKLIFENVTEKNPEDENSLTPLHYAAKNGHTDIVELTNFFKST